MNVLCTLNVYHETPFTHRNVHTQSFIYYKFHLIGTAVELFILFYVVVIGFLTFFFNIFILHFKYLSFRFYVTCEFLVSFVFERTKLLQLFYPFRDRSP